MKEEKGRTVVMTKRADGSDDEKGPGEERKR